MRRYAVLCLLTVLPAAAQAQPAPLSHRIVEVSVDSGAVENLGRARAVTYSASIQVEGASWLRLFFSQADLGRVPGRADGTVLRMTSLEDGAVQIHTPVTLNQWRRSSAFFNGDEVLVELIADPAAPASRLRVHQVMAGEPAAPSKSICGTVDDRVLSFDDRAARIVPVGCSAWLIDDLYGCFLTAGHCLGGAFQVAQFNVPLSDPDGSINHPGPEDQYAIDATSTQGIGAGVGNDWGYFGAFPNSETGLTPVAAQGTTYVLDMPPAMVGGETIRITGYGLTTGTQGTPLEWDLVQKTHTGALTSVGGTSVRYTVDTTGGNSGSCVLNEDTGLAIGIHTHGGCTSTGGSNAGTGLDNAGVQNALANPLGICQSLFSDGFESGDTTGWPNVVG